MSYAPSTQFFISRSQEQEGPVTFEGMQQMLTSGELQPDHLCWAEGMAEWVTVASVLPAAPAKPMTMKLLPISEIEKERLNPYAPPRSDLGHNVHVSRDGGYGGLTRLPYFLASVVLTVIQVVVMESDYAPMMIGLAILYVVGAIYTTLLRIKNLGISRWWLLWMCVPVLNIIATYRLLICQEGWGDSRTLDKTGRVLLWILLAVIGLVIAAAFILPTVAD